MNSFAAASAFEPGRTSDRARKPGHADFILQPIRLTSYPHSMTNMEKSARRIRAVLFDFDGTLTEPGSLDFSVVRNAVGCPAGLPVLEFINGIESETDRASAWCILDAFEADAARQSRPNACAEDILEMLRVRGLQIGIISRNSRNAIMTALRNFTRIPPEFFSVILSRDDPYDPKPSPDGILAAAKALGIPAEEVLVVGDFIYDMEAGRNAGALTAYLTNRNPARAGACAPDFILEHLGELKEIIHFLVPRTACSSSR